MSFLNRILFVLPITLFSAPSAVASFPAIIDESNSEDFGTHLSRDIVIDGTVYYSGNIAFINDLDGDGAPERVLAPYVADTSIPYACGTVYVIPSLANMHGEFSASEFERFAQYSNVPLNDETCPSLESLKVIDDINGDNLDELVFFGPISIFDTSSITVLFGTNLDNPIDVNNLDGSNGFTINNIRFNGEQGVDAEFDSVGDVNGDGINDLAIRSDEERNSIIGIYAGRTTGFPAILDREDKSQYLVSVRSTGILRVEAIGDVNGDNLTDIMLGFEGYWLVPRITEFESEYREGFRNSVIYGSTEFPATFDDTINFESMPNIAGCDFIICGFVGVGDLNGDGFDDLATTDLLDIGITDVRDMQIIFGAAEGIPTELNDDNTLRIPGRQAVFNTSPQPSDIGSDFNSDGIDDLMADGNGREIYFGAADINNRLSAVSAEQWSSSPALLNGEDGFTIRSLIGEPTNGDFNSDGLNDVLFDDYLDAYILYGRTTSTPITNEITAPEINSAARYSSTAGEITWQRQTFSESVPQYEVRRNSQLLTTTSGTSYFDNALPDDGEHRYTITTVLNAQRSVDAATTIPAQGGAPLDDAPDESDLYPLAPRILVYSDNASELFWNRLTDASGTVQYEISKNNELIASTDGTSYFDPSYSTTEPNEYEIVAFAANGSILTTDTIATGMSEPDLPPADEFHESFGLRGQVYSSTALELFWSSSTTHAVSFSVSTNRGEPLSVDGRSLYLDNLQPGTAYHFSLLAINATGESVEESITVTTNDR